MKKVEDVQTHVVDEKSNEEALRRVEKLPRNWVSIRWTLQTIVEEGELVYLDYRRAMPKGKYWRHYNFVWDNLDEYARKVGILIEFEYGPAGGYWSSKWKFRGLMNSFEELVEEYFDAFMSSGRVHRAIKDYDKFTSGEHFEALIKAVKKAEKKGYVKPERFIIASEIYFTRKKGSEEWEFYDDENESWWFNSDDYDDYDDLKLSEFIEKHKKKVIDAFYEAKKEAKERDAEIQGVDGYEYDVRAGIIVEG